MNNYKLGEYIQNKRIGMGLSLREFGQLCGISHTTIDNIEKGYDPRTGKPVNITNTTFKHLASGLNVPIEVLVSLSVSGVSNRAIRQEAPTSSGERKNIIKLVGRNGAETIKVLTDAEYENYKAEVDHLPEADDL